jgi:hypothetical protein
VGFLLIVLALSLIGLSLTFYASMDGFVSILLLFAAAVMIYFGVRDFLERRD